MATPDGMFLYIGTYPSEAAARADYDVVKDLHATDVVGTYDAAVVTKDASGQGARQQGRDGDPARRLGWCGGGRRRRHPLPAGGHRHARSSAPPSARSSGHLWRGISRSDVKELGELIDAGEAALLVVGASTLEQALDKAELKAEKHVAKQLDVSTADVDAAVKDAAQSRLTGRRLSGPHEGAACEHSMKAKFVRSA